mgnify:CR=1 FL=1
MGFIHGSGCYRQVKMSAQTLQQTPDLSTKAQTLLSFLSDEVKSQGGVMYVKGKFIADDVDLSAKEIGQLMTQLQDADTDISVEAWSYTGATTWRVAN